MLVDRYFEAIDKVLEKSRRVNRETMEKLGEVIADCVSRGGQMFIYDSGHLVNQELLYRAGGALYLKKFEYSFSVKTEPQPRKRDSEPGIALTERDILKVAFAHSDVRPGDVFIVGSVSGNSVGVVDMALTAKDAGCTLVCITSLEASPRLEAKHPCGKRLCELGDYVLDNCAPYGDAMLQVEGVEQKCFPASGLGAAYTLWATIACATESLVKRGISPTMLRSANLPDGMDYLQTQHKRYQELGY